MKPAARHTLFERFHEQNPLPTTELCFTSPFELLVSVILSAQATDISVNKATAVLYPLANTPHALLAMGETHLTEIISSIGLYRTKAKHIIATCKRLIDEFSGEVPRTREALESLPGVGRKTANVVLNTVFGEATIAVDTHIFRVANRTGLARGRTPLAVEQALIKNIPKQYQQHAHHWLLLHGRYTCTARSPKCKECIIRDICEYSEKTDA